MGKEYDIVFFTNTPVFYKINLFKEVVKHRSVLMVFLGYGDEAVNADITNNKFDFDYVFLNKGEYKRRHFFPTFYRLLRLMSTIKAKRVIFSGWEPMEYNIYAFISKKRKNAIIVESTIVESTTAGIKGFIKRLVVGRMSDGLPCGEPHAKLLKALGFNGRLSTTGSVGIFNKKAGEGGRNVRTQRGGEINASLRFLYVGRLVEVKDLPLLIEAFNENGKSLTIVGDGHMKGELQRMSKSNISFHGFVDNTELGKIYTAHDVLILPSYSETWGMVIEEALYWGLPVIVSDHVGSSVDIVKGLGAGMVFRSGDVESLKQKVVEMTNQYEKYISQVASIDFIKRDEAQVKVYVNL